MTNFEWLIKNDAELIKSILAQHMSKEKGIPKLCSDIDCRDCDFDWNSNSLKDCCINTKNWLDEEYKPLYKEGDIVIDSSNKIAVVIEACGDDGYIKISSYADEWYGRKIHIAEIKKMVGHIEESEV